MGAFFASSSHEEDDEAPSRVAPTGSRPSGSQLPAARFPVAEVVGAADTTTPSYMRAAIRGTSATLPATSNLIARSYARQTTDATTPSSTRAAIRGTGATLPATSNLIAKSYSKQASDDKVSKCPVCSKTFGNRASRKQHQRDAHGSDKAVVDYSCKKCSRAFRSRTALRQHTRDVHDGLRVEDLDDPVESPGRWLARETHPGPKSFGAFECTACRHYWVSAHGYKAYRQGCARCERRTLPKFMWLNASAGDDDGNKRDCRRLDGPHDTVRCEACEKGVCDLAEAYAVHRGAGHLLR